MEELDPFCDQFQDIEHKDSFYDNLYQLGKYLEETSGDAAAAIALDKFHKDPDFNENFYKIWLYRTCTKWLNTIRQSNKFTSAEEVLAIYMIRAITEIARTAFCYNGCNILSEFNKILSNSFSEYTLTGWEFLCSEQTYANLILSRNSIGSATSSHYVSEYEAEAMVEAYDENVDTADELREYEEKCKIISDIVTKFLSSKFVLTLVRLAAQKFTDRTLNLQSDMYFNVPYTYYGTVEGKKSIALKKDKKGKEGKKEEAPEEEADVKEEVVEVPKGILPSTMTLEAESNEFWEALEMKYAPPELPQLKQQDSVAQLSDQTKSTKKRKKSLVKKE